MFAEGHNEYLDTFFAEHSHPGISWIHDLGRGRYALASQALLTEAEHAPELVSKHVGIQRHLWFSLLICNLQLMLSMGKLSHLAQLHEGTKAINQDVLDGTSTYYISFPCSLTAISQHSTTASTS